MTKVVCIPYDRLLDPNADLTGELVEVCGCGFSRPGPNSLVLPRSIAEIVYNHALPGARRATDPTGWELSLCLVFQTINIYDSSSCRSRKTLQ